MTQYEFTQLTAIEQEEFVWDNGVFVATRQQDDLIYDIYSVGEFYVQFAYHINDYESIMISTLNKVSHQEFQPVK